MSVSNISIIEDLRNLSFYKSLLGFLNYMQKNDSFVFESEELTSQFGDIAYSFAIYLESNGYAKRALSKSGGKFSFDNRFVSTIIPLVKLRIKDLQRDYRERLITICVSTASAVASIIAIVLSIIAATRS